MTNEAQKLHKKISKLLSLVLRHSPETLGIELDANGWTGTQKLIAAANNSGTPLNLKLLKAIVMDNDKQRFAFNEDHSMIRANQGHTIEVDLNLSPSKPPELLYHGTVAKFLESIMKHGLSKMERQHVHLSPDIETAKKVGGRRGKPVILRVSTGQMFENGHVFYLSKNKVWLTDHVPPKYLLFD